MWTAAPIASVALSCSVVDSFWMPAGPALYGYTIVTCVRVTDSIGTSNYLFIRGVTVYPMPLGVADISRIIAGSFLNASQQGNPPTVSSFSNALIGSLQAVFDGSLKTASEVSSLSRGLSADHSMDENETAIRKEAFIDLFITFDVSSNEY